MAEKEREWWQRRRQRREGAVGGLSSLGDAKTLTLDRWYHEDACLGYGSVSVRPLCVMVMYPSSMSMLGVPYSPMVPSFTRWQSGA